MIAPPLAPMLAKLARTLPRGGHYVYEPKWDGFRALAFRDGEHVDVRSRHDRPLARYFPEIVESLLRVPETRFVLDGEIVVVGKAGLDFGALLARVHPSATRVAMLRRETPALFVAFDLVTVGDDDLRGLPFARRRARLAELIEPVAAEAPHLTITPATADADLAQAWVERFRGGGLDGVVAKDLAGTYEPGRRAMIKVKQERTLDCVVGGFRVLGERGPLASLLLGLWDGEGDDERLVHVGVASQFTNARRRELFVELAREIVPLAGHPWEKGFGLERSPIGRLKGAAGRWSPEEMEQDWIPIAPTRVCEVAYGTLDERRFRHPARFLRWRPDREARSCRFDQIDEAAPDVRGLLVREAS